ncbi:hypothetical protein PTSG_01617 [Salpingoeca rosetta]|uniref:Uncharacterized protein n=1 Tax=Salpingoeca rosetta (strain ATCC 50818 / BSB-021) TaxID=946362 RepID=F2TYG5_SALR5|nr:uncharacterized protein PTSG_01617 [Salpingoeca rosetta]EGD78639.1 hypothetical protein PTSG_01617 [Salpingoeca rosetta]|eukprot:XP_004997597.1 hypothetical protein PTSG_01617 [Salpingoeca rosetta]
MTDIVRSRDGKAFERTEVVRLVAQTLTELGYRQALDTMDKVEFVSEDKRRRAVAVLHREHFFDLVTSGQKLEALRHLRTKLTAYYTKPDDLKRFTNFLMSTPTKTKPQQVATSSSSSPADVQRQSRQEITAKLEAVDAQRCLSVSDASGPCSLLGDKRPVDIPRKLLFKLKPLKDEIWFVEFSPTGQYLAAAGRSKSVSVFDTLKRFKRVAKIRCPSPVASISWAPDGQNIAIGHEDARSIQIYNMDTREVSQTWSHHSAGPCVCAFGPTNAFASCSSADGRVLYFASKEALQSPTHTWRELRGIQLVFSPDETKLIVAAHDKRIHIFNLSTFEEEASISTKGAIMSLKLSGDGKFLLVSTKPAVVQLFDIEKKALVQEFTGHVQERFMIRSCFGPKDKFVISGSEDGKAYLWHRETAQRVAKLVGHDGAVNDVSWHPRCPYVVVTASDDHSVFVWGPSHFTRRDLWPLLKNPETHVVSPETNGETDGLFSADDTGRSTRAVRGDEGEDEGDDGGNTSMLSTQAGATQGSTTSVASVGMDSSAIEDDDDDDDDDTYDYEDDDDDDEDDDWHDRQLTSSSSSSSDEDGDDDGDGDGGDGDGGDGAVAGENDSDSSVNMPAVFRLVVRNYMRERERERDNSSDSDAV